MTDQDQEEPATPPLGETTPALDCPGEAVLFPGDQLGKYVISRQLGQGGMGVVYEAQDKLLRRPVAIKVVRGKELPDGETTQRFLREARAVAQLHHPNVVTIHEIDRYEAGYFLVMELVPGGSAQDQLQSQIRLNWEVATRVIADACRGLVAAHAAGVIHRDMKPANLLIGADGVAKLADFGMARNSNAADGTITGIGHIAGTPAFMSPEQCRGEQVDTRTDIYSLGATYYTLLTGAFPFPREAAVEIMLAHCAGPVPDPRRRTPDVPEGCARIVQQAMAKDPSDRYPTAQAMLVDLESQIPVSNRTSNSHLAVPSLARRRLAGSLAIVLLAVLTAGVVQIAWRLSNPSPARNDPAPSGDNPVEPANNPVEPTLVAREFLLPGHLDAGGEVEAIAFSRDDRLLAWATTKENSIRVLHLRTGQRSSAALPERARRIALSPDGRTLALASSQSRVHLWDTTNGLSEKQGLEFPHGSVNALAFSPDGQMLAVGILPPRGREVTLQVWRPGTAEKPQTLTRHKGPVVAVAFSPDGATLASACRDGAIHLWKTADWSVLHSMQVDSGHVFAMAFSPDGCRLATALVGGLALVPTWDTATGERLFSLSGHARWGVASVAYAPSGRVIASGGLDGVRLWDASTGKQHEGMLEKSEKWLYQGLAYSHDGTVLVTGAPGLRLRVWHVDERPVAKQP